mgnify:CR=1 FL=1
MKKNIIVMKDGTSVGFVKSISEEKESFAITKNKDRAKGYKNEDSVQSDIDVLTRISSDKGYVFLYV